MAKNNGYSRYMHLMYVLLAAALVLLAPHARAAEAYPTQPIRIVDPFSVGGSTDFMARLIGQKLAERLKQPVVVENRAGAGGNIAAEFVAKAPADGHTLLLAPVGALAPAKALYPQLRYDILKDFEFISLLASGSYVLIASPTIPARSLKEVVALARSPDGKKLSYGSAGVGSQPHIAGELLNAMAGTRVLHVPYKGAAPVLTAVAAGEVQFGFGSVAGVMPLVKTGRVVPIAVTSARRSKALPDVPTIAESGYPGFDITAQYGILAPANTPAAVIDQLNAGIGEILKMPDIQEKLLVQGLETGSSTSARFRELMQSEISTMTKIIQDAGIRPE